MISKPKFKVCRRLGPGVYDKCQTSKFHAPTWKSGGSTKRRPKAPSEYGAQLIEKQKIRFSYGISERQLANYVKGVAHIKGVGTAEKLYERLEFRLDNAVYRMGLAPTRRAARQMVSHGHFIVNDRKIAVPSHKLSVGDVIKIREGSKAKKIFTSLEEAMKDYTPPPWIVFDLKSMEGKILDKPKNTEGFLDLNAVLEFYSR